MGTRHTVVTYFAETPVCPNAPTSNLKLSVRVSYDGNLCFTGSEQNSIMRFCYLRVTWDVGSIFPAALFPVVPHYDILFTNTVSLQISWEEGWN